ncbi:MAG: hypothetical protein H0T46_34590 [Deltaproteobacteria bacterium]|nr:hypothetical protein [Deltaproteobacteria bacterium]
MRLLIAASAALLIQCSPTPKPALPVEPPGPLAATSATPDAAVEEEDDDDFGYTGYFFEWQQLRDERD